jgi:xanthine dehydrogenase accessory factor
VLQSGRPKLVSMSLGDEEAWEIGLTCGGTVDVLVEPVDARNATDPLAVAYRAVRSALASGRTVLAVARLDGGAGRLVVGDSGAIAGTLGDRGLDAVVARTALERLRAATPSGVERVSSDEFEIPLYLERHAPEETVVIYGAVQVAMSLTVFARELGMRTVVVDGRERFATRQRFPAADEILVGMPSEIAEGLPATPSTYVVLVAHDYKYELPVLRHALRSSVGYVGMLGSRKRGATIKELLAEEGFTAAELARLRTPIGLDIGARSTAEIALAVIAEIVAVREGRTAPPMSRIAEMPATPALRDAHPA